MLTFFVGRWQKVQACANLFSKYNTEGLDVVNRVTPVHLVVLKLFQTKKKPFCKSIEIDIEAPAGLYWDANLGKEKVH